MRRFSVYFGLLLGACGGGVVQGPQDGATTLTQDGGTIVQDAAQPTGDAQVGVTDGSIASADAVAPTPPSEWQPVTANLAGMMSECGNVSAVFANPKRDELIVGIAREGLWASTDGAASWHKLGTSGDTILNRTSDIVWDPSNNDTFYQAGIYGWESPYTDGVFITTNDGASFKGYATLAMIQSHNDSVAIDFSDPARKTILSGGHEQKQVLFVSTDAGATWTDIGMHMPAGTGFCTATAVIDSKTFLVGCDVSWSGAAAGAILRSTDGGATFSSAFGKGVTGQPLHAADGSFYWALEGGGIVKSTDKGVSWNAVADSNTAGSLPPLQLPDGRLASTHGQSIVVSADKGATWTKVGSDMPFNANAFTYSAQRSAFFASYFTCTDPNSVPANGIVRFGWDYRVNE